MKRNKNKLQNAISFTVPLESYLRPDSRPGRRRPTGAVCATSDRRMGRVRTTIRPPAAVPGSPCPGRPVPERETKVIPQTSGSKKTAPHLVHFGRERSEVVGHVLADDVRRRGSVATPSLGAAAVGRLGFLVGLVLLLVVVVVVVFVVFVVGRRLQQTPKLGRFFGLKKNRKT